MQFLTLLYQADYVEPWREFNQVDYNAAIPLQTTYEYTVARVHSASPNTAVSASIHIPFTNCPLGNCNAIHMKGLQTLQSYWRINRSNPRGSGAVPFVITMSNYVEPVWTDADLGYAHLTAPSVITPNNFARVLNETANLFTDPAERAAFRHTPIAVAEGSWGDWCPPPLTPGAPRLPYCQALPPYSPFSDAIARLIDEKQAAYLKWMLDYRHDPSDPAVHPMLFVANWWGTDVEGFADPAIPSTLPPAAVERVGTYATFSGIIGGASQRYGPSRSRRSIAPR